MNKTALLILDPQNDLLSPEGKLYAATKPVLEKYAVIANLNKLIAIFNEFDSTIIFSPITFSEDYSEAGHNPYGVMTSVISSQGMIKGTFGGDISNLLDRKESDIVIERSSIIAFEGTELEKILKEKGINTLVLCGLLSDICIEGTMRAAYGKGFEVYVSVDATATLSLEKQQITMEHSFPLFSKSIETAPLLSMLIE